MTEATTAKILATLMMQATKAKRQPVCLWLGPDQTTNPIWQDEPVIQLKDVVIPIMWMAADGIALETKL